MDEEAQKRNTDCVYFLASPLTCKKGADCEYRHSEAARVNPRDCWYWLSGNCLNASCSFRHPPLDGRPGVATASHPSQVAGGVSSSTATPTASTAGSSIPSTSTIVSAPPTTSKSTVPCFFFSQGYCGKGVKCPFLHGTPAQYRKEATVYQRPQGSDQPANGEGSGASNNAKQRIHEHKSAPQGKAPVRAAVPSQEGGYISSNVYKLSASGIPTPSGKHISGNAGEKVEQSSQVGGPKVVQSSQVGGPKLSDITRCTQFAESRILHSHFSTESPEQFTLGEKGFLKGQPLHLDSRRTIKQVRQSAAPHIHRSIDPLQDPFYEPEGQQSAHELHADDLRNHLKRKKNESIYSNQLKDFWVNEFSKDHIESARLASRAIIETEPRDFVPVKNKRAKQEKEDKTFSGPKSLAQIKAEKSKPATQGCVKAAEFVDDCRNEKLNSGERKDIFDSASTYHVTVMPELGNELPHDHSARSVDVNNFESKSIVHNGASDSRATSHNARSGVGIRNSNGLSSVLVCSTASEEAKMAGDHSGKAVAPMLKRRHSLRNETISGANRPAHASEGPYSKTGYGLANDLIENGSEARQTGGDVDSAFDYDDEDDFTRKLGSYLS